MISAIFFSLGLTVSTPTSLTANDLIRSGDIITQENTSPEGDVWQDEHNALLGREVRRTIYAGQSIQQKDTQSPRLVKRNQLVTVKYMNGPLEISLTGRAMGEAGLDETVPVLNLQSRQVVEGTVQAGGWIWVK
ncbi:MAG: flagellar basal body P-ring formation chaperone FlgA [Pseudomonadota bacterium]|jgi:flagella basal body P-ring formation protein FlgA|nr:flagellar basal body P-ring formation chaperone FlgA [Pseudomonadota bacterium]